ncbi:MAG: hypothetical protein ACD_50C00115G0008 [uncultured bacterium]|nr:MAG: hypothetical protein ACD_50C00115G0008 [uncultured bacterium]OGH13167.1 MAG: hypothetical protein A2687_05275 [Candidatus Levybacteria bacterium RIFCSPHIGHO2_01_FULL_38_26]
MDSTPEKEQPKSEREVSLGEDINPFDPEYAPGFTCAIKLNIGERLKIPLEISAMLGLDMDDPERENYILPFNPEEGYPIDPADFNIKTRIEKVERMRDELKKPIDINTADNSVLLFIWSDTHELKRVGFNKELEDKKLEFPGEMQDLLKRLRVLINIPGRGRFEARPDQYFLSNHGEILFLEYYPADFGPLATSNEYTNVLALEGFSLGLPFDQEKLKDIRARFVLAEEEPKDTQA